MQRAVVSSRRRQATIDVVVPCYNYARFLAGCVRSVLGQAGVAVRVLIIDDTSDDETPEAIAELSADPRVVARRHDVNKGNIATYNEGLAWAEADYTVLLSADDLLAPGALARAASVMDDHPGVGMVYGRGVYFENHDDLPRTLSAPSGIRIWPGSEWIEGRCRTGRNVISSPEVTVRTSVQHEVGGYRAELPHAGDLDMWLRIAAVSDVSYVRGKAQAYYRVHSQSMLRSHWASLLPDFEQRRAVFDTFFVHYGSCLEDPQRLHDLARRALARDALWAACRAIDRNRTSVVPFGELVAFAAATYPAFDTLREYRAFRRRQRLGEEFCSRTGLFIASSIGRRSRHWLWQQGWKWRGV